MAKRVRISDDAGANWYTLPGGTGELSLEAGDIDDTIFGYDYKSSEIGLVKWMVSADALYKGFAGYVADIKKVGSTTPMTTEGMTLETGKIYQITNSSKQVWDRSAVFTVFDNAVDHTADVEWFDYLFGRIKFLDAYTVTSPVTVTGSYFPTTSIGKANAFTLTQTADPIQTSDFETVQGNGGYHTFIQGLKTVSLELTGIYTVSNAFVAALAARAEVIVELNPEGLSRSVARGFFKFASQGQSGDVGALEEEKVTLNLQVPDDSQPIYLPFHWRHSGTSTLATAVQKLLEAWRDGSIVDVQYLYDGTNGRSGEAVVTELTLTGGLEDMNKFAVQLQGSGALGAEGTG